MPKGVICLASTLAFQGLTDQMPPKVWIAIGRKDWCLPLTYPPIRVARFSDELLRRSVERNKIAGTLVPVFSVAKTVADLFRYRRTVWAMRLPSRACAKRCGSAKPRLRRSRAGTGTGRARYPRRHRRPDVAVRLRGKAQPRSLHSRAHRQGPWAAFRRHAACNRVRRVAASP